MKYVTYDDAGNLTGAYLQDLRGEHADNHIEVTDDVFNDWTDYRFENGQVVKISTPDVPVLTLADYVSSLEKMYDDVARSRRYDNRITCALRAGYPGPFRAEGEAFATWMDTCNELAYTLLKRFEDGEITQPTIPEVIAAMPVINWP